MADVTPSVSVFEQVQLIAGLRWRILRNSLRKKNSRLDLIGLILTGVFSSVLVIGFCFAFYAGAHTFVSQGRLEWMALLFWVILFSGRFSRSLSRDSGQISSSARCCDFR